MITAQIVAEPGKSYLRDATLLDFPKSLVRVIFLTRGCTRELCVYEKINFLLLF